MNQLHKDLPQCFLVIRCVFIVCGVVGSGLSVSRVHVTEEVRDWWPWQRDARRKTWHSRSTPPFDVSFDFSGQWETVRVWWSILFTQSCSRFWMVAVYSASVFMSSKRLSDSQILMNDPHVCYGGNNMILIKYLIFGESSLIHCTLLFHCFCLSLRAWWL